MQKEFKIKNLNVDEIPFKNFNNPSALNRYNKTQKQITETITASKKSFIMLSAPTGLGKSLICSMAAYTLSDKINYVCSDKQLQDQLLHDFPEAVVLKGRSNYSCNLFPHLNADTCVGQCSEYKAKQINCNYYDKKAELLASDFRILNTFYLLFEMNYAGQLKGQDLIIIDEADTLDLNFISFVSLQVSDGQIKKYGLGYPKLTIVESWIEWAGNSIIKLEAAYTCKDKTGKDIGSGLDPDLVKAQKLIKKLKLFILLVQDDWIYNRHHTYSEFKPVWITKELIQKYLFSHADRFILCSASLPPKATICNTLMIDPDDCDYIEVGSSFLPENRKVIYEPVMDMSYKNRDKYMTMVDWVEEKINQFPDYKGIIHSQSYALRDLIMEIGSPRLITHDSKDKQKKLAEFKSSTEPLVFVSPSCVRGLSLNDDLCRFGICPKMPFPNLGDKAIAQRCYGSGKKGKNWYNAETAQAVLQMSGRHVRSYSDWGVMFIGDSCFERVRKSLADWFNKDIIEDFDYGEEEIQAKCPELLNAGITQPEDDDFDY